MRRLRLQRKEERIASVMEMRSVVCEAVASAGDAPCGSPAGGSVRVCYGVNYTGAFGSDII